MRGQRASVALWLVVLAGLSVVLVAALAVVLHRSPRPNVLLVVVDALRRDHVGAYDYVRPVTPFLDQLARRGVVFDNAWSHAPQTFNSTAALFTGRMFPLLLHRDVPPGEVSWTAYPLAPQNVTLAEVLADAGYDTLAIFTNPHHAAESGFGQGVRVQRYVEAATYGQAHATATEVNAAARDMVAELDASRPFFAYVHYMDVHNPYRPPEELARLFVTVDGQDRYTNGVVPGEHAPSSDDLRFMIDSYDACIRYVDDRLRELVEIFGAASNGRETVVVVTADHGDEFMEHGGLGHGHSMHQELLRVPLVASGGGLPSGVRVQRLARGIDVLPTLAELAGVAPPAASEGRSLLPLVEAARHRSAADGGVLAVRAAEARAVDADEDPHGYSFGWNAHLRSITTEDFHLVFDASSGRYALYDVRSDPYGRRNVKNRFPKVTRRLRLALDEYEMRLNESQRAAALLEDEAPALEERTVEQLRALGYLE